MQSLLVVGAAPDSIGAAVAHEAQSQDYDVVTAGITGTEKLNLDLKYPQAVRSVVRDINPDHVVCTAGVNYDGSVLDKDWMPLADYSMHNNWFGPMELLHQWCEHQTSKFTKGADRSVRPDKVLHWVAISSNSAHVPRSRSASYCASKAALSMGVRCVAREMKNYPFAIYTYEPGWVNGTPMSQGVLGRLGRGVEPSRTPGQKHLSKEELARMIVSNLALGEALNGCSLRVDGGEV